MPRPAFPPEAPALRGAGIDPARLCALNDIATPADGQYVLYWMQASQRERYNHALEYAALAANGLGLPLVVGFGLTPRYPSATRRAYAFLLEGLAGTAAALRARGIAFVLRLGEPPPVAIDLARDAALVVTDRGYTRHQVSWRETAARVVACPLIQVESDAVVPVETASEKEEYAARTLRPRIHRHLDRFLVPVRRQPLRVDAGRLRLPGEAFENSSDATRLLDALDADASVPPVAGRPAGEAAAAKRLRFFLDKGLDAYDAGRNDPNRLDAVSGLSPYLHFGQISPLDVALQVRRRGGDGVAPFLEQLVVRRELALNFVYYNDEYDRYACLPNWCRQALARHGTDSREVVYSPEAFDAARTHDAAWNAAQTEMVRTGSMSGYMRMYWGKKLLEWSARPEDAFALALRLNDRYELDGRDPNGYAGVAWCFGQHDRPWTRRPVFGTVRYMNEKGLRRKFDVDAYIRRVDALPL